MPERKWQTRLGGAVYGHAATRQAAMNLADRPYRPGLATVRHLANGETWERKRGSWYKSAPARRANDRPSPQRGAA